MPGSTPDHHCDLIGHGRVVSNDGVHARVFVHKAFVRQSKAFHKLFNNIEGIVNELLHAHVRRLHSVERAKTPGEDAV